MQRLITETDFSKSKIGPRETWPQSLRTALSICLSSRFPMIIFWGRDLCVLYNDAYIPIFAKKHPAVLGKTGYEAWGEVWDVIDPMFRSVMERREATWSQDQLLLLERKGFVEETYFTWSYSPIDDETGGVGGVFTAVFETTERVIAERRLVTLRELGAQVAQATRVSEACEAAVETLTKNFDDVPFAQLYLLDQQAQELRLTAHGQLPAGSTATPLVARVDADNLWPFASVIKTGEIAIVDKVIERFGELHGTRWPDPVRCAVVIPIHSADAGRPFGVLIVGASPRLELDNAYLDFLRLAGNHVASALASAHGHEEERRRLEALAEIDRAKTAFFSNISHEFRTPLTLMLGPLEDALAAEHPALTGESLSIAHRNALRLLKLVNALLDFSRLEAGRMQAHFEAKDLAELTREIAAAFEPAMKSAGLQFTIDCSPLSQPVYVDTEMWEKVVLNLLSNAFKFTFEGGVYLSLSAVGDQVELVVRDTGTGVPEHEVPRLFERFHRVDGAKSRTHEGSGIGLALVHELVRIHGGEVSVTSKVGAGSTFRVRMPLGFKHLPQDRIGSARAQASSNVRARAYVDEAAHWIPERDAAGADVPAFVRDARILVADDNADMRNYIGKLLAERWSVELVADGVEALEAARRSPPDVIVSDIMMPRMDGLELLRQLRADPELRHTPLVFLSARAGDEARASGLEAGADDYLVKPFSARELTARVNTHIELSRLRADARTLQRISTLVSAELDLQRLLQLITDETTRLVGAQFGAFFYNLVDDAGEHYTLYTLSGAPKEAFSKFPLPRNTHLFGPTFRGEGVIRLDDVTQDPRYGQNAPYHGMPKGHLPVTSYLAAPVVSRSGEVLGGLFFGHSQPAMFTDRHERLLVGVAAQGAIAIDNARLYDQVSSLLTRERAARTQAEAASRAKDEFLAILGHELRNPLAPIHTALQLMEMRGDPATREREVIQRQVQHLVRLVDDLLDVSRITRGKIELHRESVELEAIVARALEMAAPLIEQKRHTISMQVAATGLAIYVDPGRFEQVVSNLLTNAAKYTPPQGQITVIGERDNERVILRVRDTGIGIPPEALTTVFEAFVQAPQALDRSRGGLGLGLTIVRNLVELHEGKVTAHSDGEGRGSEFRVELTAHELPQRLQHNATSAPATSRTTPSRRVLVVDDNHDAAQLLVEALRALGHETESASDGPSALAAAARFVPDLALLDIGLPVMDGYELARRMRSMPELQQTRLIALTGYGQANDRARSHEAGFDAHYVKPLPLDKLESIVESVG